MHTLGPATGAAGVARSATNAELHANRLQTEANFAQEIEKRLGGVLMKLRGNAPPALVGAGNQRASDVPKSVALLHQFDDAAERLQEAQGRSMAALTELEGLI